MRKKMEDALTPLPEMSFDILTHEKALEMIKEGIAIQEKKLPFLHLDRMEIQHNFVLKNCQVQGFTARGSTFAQSIVLEGCTFEERVELSAEKKQELIKTHLSGNLQVKNCKFKDNFFGRNMVVNGEVCFENTKIANGLSFDRGQLGNVRFNESCELSISAYRTLFKESLTIQNCTLVNFKDKALDLREGKIRQTLSILGSKLESKTDLRRINLGEEARQALVVDNTIFQEMDINEGLVHGEVHFFHTKFLKKINADTPKLETGRKVGKYTNFKKDISFVNCTFSDVSFYKVSFGAYANFKKCTFIKGGNFNSSEFSQIVSFWESKSEGALHFRKTHFGGRTNFANCTLGAKKLF